MKKDPLKGALFTFNQIVVLDRCRYEEAPDVTVGPSWSRGMVGTHTYSHLAKIEVIDGCWPVPARHVLGRS